MGFTRKKHQAKTRFTRDLAFSSCNKKQQLFSTPFCKPLTSEVHLWKSIARSWSCFFCLPPYLAKNIWAFNVKIWNNNKKTAKFLGGKPKCSYEIFEDLPRPMFSRNKSEFGKKWQKTPTENHHWTRSFFSRNSSSHLYSLGRPPQSRQLMFFG